MSTTHSSRRRAELARRFFTAPAHMRPILLALCTSLLTTACLHTPRGAHAGPVALRVMTYNIRSGNGDLAHTAEAIRAQSPDLVGLEEVDVHWAERSAFADQASELGERLHMNVRFARIYRLPGTPGQPPREFGVALLSRFPITRFRDDTLTRLSTQEENPVPTPMPGLLDAEVDAHGTPVRVLVTHLDYRKDPRVRETQVREMVGRLGDRDEPTLVLGDMNATPQAPELQPLLHGLTDSWAVAGSGTGYTYPADVPDERIDYVLATRQFRVRGAQVPATQASDHRPVVAELELER